MIQNAVPIEDNLLAMIEQALDEAVRDAYDEANKDFNWLQSAVAKIYCHFTDNKLSKWNYDPQTVISEIEDCQNQFWEKEIESAKKEGTLAGLEIAAGICETYEEEWTKHLLDHINGELTPLHRFLAKSIRAKAKELAL